MTAQELKNSILQLAIQGKLVKQDPNDEPASVLLEKIKEEREKLIKEKKIKKEKYSEIYKDQSDNHYYEKFEDGTINDITEEIPFDIPESWKWVRHNQLFDIVGGSQPPKSEFSDIKMNGYVRLYQIRDYGDNPVPIYVDESKVSKFSKKGDIILARYGGSLGKVFWAENGAYNVALAKVCKNYESDNLIFDKFLFNYYLSGIYQSFVKSTSRSAQAGFNKDDLNSLFFPLPPFNEQKRIVNKIEFLNPYIDKYLSINDELELLNKSYNENLKKSILQYAIQGKLVKQDPNDESAEILINKILDEKRELIKTKQIKKENLSVIYKDDTDNQFYEKFDDGTIINITDEIPFEIPENWCWSRLFNICTKIVDGDHNPPPGQNLKTEYIMLSAKNIQDNKLVDFDNARFLLKENYEKGKKRISLKDGDILLTIVGTLGRSCIYNDIRKNILFQRSVSVISTLINNKYLKFVFDSPYIQNKMQNESTGTAQRGFYLNQLSEVLIPVPPINEEILIINKLKEILKTAE